MFAAAGAFGIDRYLAVPVVGAATPPPPIPLVTAPVEQGSVPILLTGIGTVQALNSAIIRSQVTGLLQTVNFIEGQKVKTGDLLAQVDPRPRAVQRWRLAVNESALQHLMVEMRRLIARGIPEPAVV